MAGDLVVLSHLRWYFVWQRPHHLISRLGKRRKTWFVEEPVPGPVDEPTLRWAEGKHVTRVWLEVPGEITHRDFSDPDAIDYGGALEPLLGTNGDRLVWLYTPLAVDIVKHLDPQVLVFDVMDDLASFKDAPEALRLREHQAFSQADLVFAGGRSLYERVRRFAPDKAHLFASGVEPEHFAVARRRQRTSERPVAGYVGVIDERLDLDLVADLAQLLPDWDIRMVGPVIKIDETTLPRANNISYYGLQPYEKLPELMGGFDVALMPFALNEATRSISPTKTLEYVAAGLPVASTRVRDVVADYATIVDLQDDARGFAAACRAVIDHSQQDRDEKLMALLKLHHWDAIAARMEDLIADVAAERRAGRRQEHRSGLTG